jgi:hypothetical protein
MNLWIMTIPDDPAELARWLERQLVGLSLPELVAELTAIHGRAESPLSLGDWFGILRNDVLARGLGVVGPDRIGLLLRHPKLLYELQDVVLSEGGRYWDELPRDADVSDSVNRSWNRLADQLTPAPAPHRPVVQPAPATAWYRRPWLVSMATAAAVLIAVWGYSHVSQSPVPPTPVAAGWGWSKPGAVPAEGPASAYLARLAEGGQEWFNKRPDDRAGLAKRIGEMRQGCTGLILATHQPLADADRKWLVDKCRDWAKKFDLHLSDLEAGKSVEVVRAEMDATVDKLVGALKKRSAELSA